jgi:hypothetical protein
VGERLSFNSIAEAETYLIDALRTGERDEDKVVEAAQLLVVSSLVQRGVDLDTAVDLVSRDIDAALSVSLTPDGELSVKFDFDPDAIEAEPSRG